MNHPNVLPQSAAVAGQARWVAACLGLYLCACLQQVVLIERYSGSALSLGSMVIRGLALCLGVWALWKHSVPVRLRRILMMIMACVASLSASVLASEHTALAFRFAVRYATMLLLLWGLLNLSVAFPRWPRAAVLAALIALWFNLALGAAVLLRWPPALNASLWFHTQDTFKYLPRISGMHEHPALLAGCALIVVLLVLQLHRRGELGRRALAFAILGAVVAMGLTQVRNVLVPVAVLVAWWAWRERQATGGRRRAPRWALAGLGALIAFVLCRRYADMTSAQHEGLLTAVSLGRTYLWAGAWDAWRSHPWFGLGPGVFQYVVSDYTGGRFAPGELHAHNAVLAVLSETGICGLIACLGLLHALWAPLLWLAIARRWALVWACVLLGMGIFDFYFAFYAFSLHAMLAVGVLYADAEPCGDSRLVHAGSV